MWGILAFIFWYIAVPVGLAYLGGLLLTSDAPKAEGEVEGAASRMWAPHTTQQEGLARPRAYGKNMHYGNIIAKWTDVDSGEREILYLLVDYGSGPTKGIVTPIIDNVFLNDQPVSNFGNVTIQERMGTMNQTVMTGFEKTKLEYLQNIELIKGEDPTIFTTPNDFFDDLEYTISWPNGLIKYHKDGDSCGWYVDLRIKISEHGEEDWTTLFDGRISARTRKPFFKKYLVSEQDFECERGKQYDLKYERVNPGTDDERRTSTTVLRSIREVVDVAFERPGRALMGLTAIATAKLSGNINVKVIREDRLIWNGTTGDIEYSNNRSWVTYDELSQPVIDGDGDGNPWVIERYEGINPKYLDLEFFTKWATFCDVPVPDGYGTTEPRCACNIIISEFTDTFTKAHEIAEVGRAYLYWTGNLLTGWIDDMVTTPIDLVTMDSMMSKTWKNIWAVAPELAGKVEVFYADSFQGYERMPAEWASTEVDSYKNPISVEGVGIKTRGVAIHYAHYLLERNRLIRNINKFRVHKDGFRYKLGDTIRLQCRIANWGSAFIVKSSTADTVTVDRDVTDEVSPGDVIHIRSYNIILSQVVTDTYEVDSVSGRIITATINWDVTPLKGNLVAVGPAGAIKLRRIIKMIPTVDNYFNVEVETYDEVLFDADDLVPNIPNFNYIWPGLIGGEQLVEPITQEEIDKLVELIVPDKPAEYYFDSPRETNLEFISTPSGGLEDYYNINDNDACVFQGDFWEAQTFKASSSYDIESVKLKLYKTSSPGTITVGIRNIDGSGHPEAPDLCSGTTDGDTLPLGPDDILHQSNSTGGDGQRVYCSACQTFTPEVSHTLHKIGLLLKKGSTPAAFTGTINLYAVDGEHKPTGASLLEIGSFTREELTTSYVWYNFADLSYSLVADTEYAIVIVVSGDDVCTHGDGDTLSYFYWDAKIGGYGRGEGWHKLCALNGVWACRLNWSVPPGGVDFCFKEYREAEGAEWREITFSEPTSLVEGTTYAIVARTAGYTGEVWWRAELGSPPGYVDGCRERGVYGTWYTETQYDYMFETYSFGLEGGVSWIAEDGINPIVITFLEAEYEITPDETDLKYIYWDYSNPNVLGSTDNPAIAVNYWKFCFNDEGIPYIY